MSMTVTLNGVATQVVLDRATLAELVFTLGLAGKRIAVEMNGEIVPQGETSQDEPAGADAPVAGLQPL